MDEDFGDFTGFSEAPSNSSAALESNLSNGTGPSTDKLVNNGSQIPNATNFAPFDVNFDIKPPMSPPPANIHLAGGVPFDIPPLPDSLSFDDFSPDMEIENPFNPSAIGIASSNNPTTTAGNETSVQTVVQPVADFSSLPTTEPEWNANFGNFDIPPPIDTGPVDPLEPPSEPSAHVKSAIIPESVTKPFESDTLAKPSTDSKGPSTNSTEAFGDFTAFNTTTTFASPPVTEGATDFSNFASFESASVAQDTVSKEKEEDCTSLHINLRAFPTEDSSFTNFGSSDVPPFPAFEDAVVEPSTITNSNGDGFSFEAKVTEAAVPTDPEDNFGNFDTAQSEAKKPSAIVSGKTATYLCMCSTVQYSAVKYSAIQCVVTVSKLISHQSTCTGTRS